MNDYLISREEVLNLIDTAFESGAFDGRCAYENLIDAVQNLIHPLGTDLVSRQAVIDTIETDCSLIMFDSYGNFTFAGERIIEAIKGIPSVEPERKPGRWIWEDGNIPYCSNCKKYSDDADEQEIHGEVKFCSHCGSLMEDTDVEI